MTRTVLGLEEKGKTYIVFNNADDLSIPATYFIFADRTYSYRNLRRKKEQQLFSKKISVLLREMSGQENVWSGKFLVGKCIVEKGLS